MNKNIFAYTELKYKSYPCFVSLNIRDGKYILSVRSTDGSNVSEAELPFIELLKLAGNINGLLSFEGDD